MSWISSAFDPTEAHPDLLVLRSRFTMDQREWVILTHSMRNGRNHDLTLFGHRDGRYAAMRKTTYTEQVFRVPSGGADSGEDWRQGAIRETLEEVGLRFSPDHLFGHSEVTFVHEGTTERILWTSLLITGPLGAGKPDPQDTREIAEARLLTADEILAYHPALLGTGIGGFRYRVFLQERAFAWLREHPEVVESGDADG